MSCSKILVVSAVNLIEGGPLTILRDCLREASAYLDESWTIIAFVHDCRLIDEPRVRLIEVPYAKKSWVRRLYWEWFNCARLSKVISPDLWVSLHDITPRVTARRQVVYCHNPAAFYKLSIRESLIEPKLLFFNLFYKYAYGTFIRRNSLVIVQQQWLRNEFNKWFGSLPIVVAHPVVKIASNFAGADNVCDKIIFLYPALPRVFKNIETVLEAAKLISTRVDCEFELRITLTGLENRYAASLLKTYSKLRIVKFIGRQTQSQMSIQYSQASAVLFPSKLETWGLPISEAKIFNKPLLVSDLPYAHETVGSYDKAQFLPPESVTAWASAMLTFIEGTWKSVPTQVERPDAPYTSNWTELWQLLVRDL